MVIGRCILKFCCSFHWPLFSNLCNMYTPSPTLEWLPLSLVCSRRCSARPSLGICCGALALLVCVSSRTQAARWLVESCPGETVIALGDTLEALAG